MAIDVKNIGMFGVSFSRAMEQTWLVLERREQDFRVAFFQNFDTEDDQDDGVFNEYSSVSHELGEQVIAAAFNNAHLENWKIQYNGGDDGLPSDLNWTIDVDDNSGADLLLLSGNWTLPPNELMTPVIEAIRLCEDRFMRCVKKWE